MSFMQERYRFREQPQDDPGQESSGVDFTQRKPEFGPYHTTMRDARGLSIPMYEDDDSPGGGGYTAATVPNPRNRPVLGTVDEYTTPTIVPEIDYAGAETRNRPKRGEVYEGYTPAVSGDLNGDGVVDEIERYQQQLRMSPGEREVQWTRENVWNRGLTVDQATGEIVDPESGQAVGRLPRFD